MSKEYTAATFAVAIGVEKEDAYSLLRFMVTVKAAENLGAKQKPGAKGRGETHYLIKDDAATIMADTIKKAL